MKVTVRCPRSVRCSTTWAMPSVKFCTTDGTPRTTRFTTTRGLRRANSVMAPSGIRGEMRMMPSASSTLRWMACCSTCRFARPSLTSTEYPSAEASSSMPFRVSTKKRLASPATDTTMTLDRSRSSGSAARLARYPRLSAICRIRCAVSGFTRPGLVSARDTVEGATPAASATS